jgi:hypothetical protein
MSFSRNMRDSVVGIAEILIGSAIAFFVLVLGLPVAEFFFARWIDPSFSTKFWVILTIFVFPTICIGLYFARPALSLFWVLVSEPIVEWSASKKVKRRG